MRITAVLEAVGEAVAGFAVGDHVVLSGNSCGQCPGCLAGTPSYCDQAMPRRFGGRLLRFYPFGDIEQAFADTAAGRVIKPVLLMNPVTSGER